MIKCCVNQNRPALPKKYTQSKVITFYDESTIASFHLNNCNQPKHLSSLQNRYHYRPQPSCGKAMFLQVPVILSRGMSGRHPQADTPQANTPQADTPPGQTPLLFRHPPGQTSPFGQTPPWEDNPLPPSDGPCSGRYTSYWNAFLLLRFVQGS